MYLQSKSTGPAFHLLNSWSIGLRRATVDLQSPSPASPFHSLSCELPVKLKQIHLSKISNSFTKSYLPSSSFTENILLINRKHPKIFSRILLLPQIFKLILFRQRDKWKSSNLIYFYRQLSIKFSLFFLSCLR